MLSHVLMYLEIRSSQSCHLLSHVLMSLPYLSHVTYWVIYLCMSHIWVMSHVESCTDVCHIFESCHMLIQIDWFWLLIFRNNLVRGLWNKKMKLQDKGAVLVQIAPLFISQPCNQNQSILSRAWVMSHTVCVWVMCVYESCHLSYVCISHVTCWVMYSHVCESYHIQCVYESCVRMSHVTCVCMSHVTYLSHVTCWVMSYQVCESCHVQCVYESCVCMSHVCVWVMSHTQKL
jgi:hypothetical protein